MARLLVKALALSSLFSTVGSTANMTGIYPCPNRGNLCYCSATIHRNEAAASDGAHRYSALQRTGVTLERVVSTLLRRQVYGKCSFN